MNQKWSEDVPIIFSIYKDLKYLIRHQYTRGIITFHCEYRQLSEKSEYVLQLKILLKIDFPLLSKSLLQM